MKRFLTQITALTFFFSLCPALSFAQEQSFSDVPPENFAFPAVEYLKSIGVIEGYSDGTFKPNQKVTRAAAVKIIVAPRVTAEALEQITQTAFSDIPPGSWYLPYVEAARQVFSFIDGPPAKTEFHGARPVIKAEFLKMLLVANNINKETHGDIQLPLSSDVTNPDEWYYPYFRYALSSSMTMVSEQGLLNPARELTRGEVALLMFRFLMYQENRRTQALLSEAENEITLILNALDENNILQAEYASARALLAARGAYASREDAPLVQSALKVTEAFRALVRGYRAGLNQEFDAVVALSKEAWSFAEEASGISPDLLPVVQEIQKSASTMADSARRLQSQ